MSSTIFLIKSYFSMALQHKTILAFFIRAYKFSTQVHELEQLWVQMLCTLLIASIRPLCTRVMMLTMIQIARMLADLY